MTGDGHPRNSEPWAASRFAWSVPHYVSVFATAQIVPNGRLNETALLCYAWFAEKVMRFSRGTAKGSHGLALESVPLST